MAASVPPSSATKRLQPFSTSCGTRARNVASRKLLASSRPVETQLSIQTRAISSYSSARAGRITGGGIDSFLLGNHIAQQHVCPAPHVRPIRNVIRACEEKGRLKSRPFVLQSKALFAGRFARRRLALLLGFEILAGRLVDRLHREPCLAAVVEAQKLDLDLVAFLDDIAGLLHPVRR